MASITGAGYVGKTLNEYLIEIQDALLAIDSGWNINPETPDGQNIAIQAELFANLEEALRAAYNAVDPRSAIGQQLDRLAAISGIERQGASASVVELGFEGANGTIVPAGTLARNTVTNTQWATVESVTITSLFATVDAQCTTLGSEPAGAGDINALVAPVGGVTGVFNAAPAVLGRDVESDAIFRERRNNSVAKPGNNQVDSMFAEIANVEAVTHVRILENFEGTADANGLDPHSLLVLTLGGEDEAVAEAIAASKNPGCGLNATNTYDNRVQLTVDTPDGNPLDVTFYRPNQVTIYVDVSATGSLAGLEGQIKQAIVDYANGVLFDPEAGFYDETGFQIGEIVAAGKLYTAVNKIVGDRGYVSSILVGDDSGDVNYQTVDPLFNGIALFDVVNITVTLT